MNKVIAIITSFFLVASFSFAASYPEVSHSAKISFDKNNNAKVDVYETTKASKKSPAKIKLVDSYQADSDKEKTIVKNFAKAYDMTYKTALTKTTFTYAPVKRGSLNTKKDDFSLSYKYEGQATILTLQINGTKHDYWFATRNLYEAASRLAKVYGVNKQTLWKSLKKNKTTR